MLTGKGSGTGKYIERKRWPAASQDEKRMMGEEDWFIGRNRNAVPSLCPACASQQSLHTNI